MCEIKNCIAQNYLELRMLLSKGPGQWIVRDLYDDSLSGPLPELPLSSPELRPIAALD